jgi:hypothetical protein
VLHDARPCYKLVGQCQQTMFSSPGLSKPVAPGDTPSANGTSAGTIASAICEKCGRTAIADFSREAADREESIMSHPSCCYASLRRVRLGERAHSRAMRRRTEMQRAHAPIRGPR